MEDFRWIKKLIRKRKGRLDTAIWESKREIIIGMDGEYVDEREVKEEKEGKLEK